MYPLNILTNIQNQSAQEVSFTITLLDKSAFQTTKLSFSQRLSQESFTISIHSLTFFTGKDSKLSVKPMSLTEEKLLLYLL
jgi:hypothetical protein